MVPKFLYRSRRVQLLLLLTLSLLIFTFVLVAKKLGMGGEGGPRKKNPTPAGDLHRPQQVQNLHLRQVHQLKAPAQDFRELDTGGPVQGNGVSTPFVPVKHQAKMPASHPPAYQHILDEVRETLYRELSRYNSSPGWPSMERFLRGEEGAQPVRAVVCATVSRFGQMKGSFDCLLLGGDYLAQRLHFPGGRPALASRQLLSLRAPAAPANQAGQKG